MAKKGGVLRTVYGVFFALLTLFVGGLLIMQVWAIYRSAPESPYTVENISKHFKEIALPVWVWLGGLAVNIFLALLIPERQPRLKSAVDGKKVLERVKGRVPAEGEYFDKAYAVHRRNRVFRGFVGTITTLFTLSAAALCVLTLFDIYYRPVVDKPFFAKQNGLVDKITIVAALSVIALTVVSFSSAIFSLSRKREQKKYLAIIADSKRPPVVEEKPVEDSAELVETVEVVEEAETVEEVESEAAVEVAPVSPWISVVEKIVGNFYAEQKIPQEEIDEEIYQILKAREPVEEPVAEEEVVEEIVEEVEETVVEEPEKAVKPKKPLVKQKKAKKERPKARKAGVALVRIALAAAGVALVALGVYNGGMKDVLLKAINICTQCIGLG